jgi:hypothetical protein
VYKKEEAKNKGKAMILWIVKALVTNQLDNLILLVFF